MGSYSYRTWEQYLEMCGWDEMNVEALGGLTVEEVKHMCVAGCNYSQERGKGNWLPQVRSKWWEAG